MTAIKEDPDLGPPPLHLTQPVRNLVVADHSGQSGLDVGRQKSFVKPIELPVSRIKHVNLLVGNRNLRTVPVEHDEYPGTSLRTIDQLFKRRCNVLQRRTISGFFRPPQQYADVLPRKIEFALQESQKQECRLLAPTTRGPEDSVDNVCSRSTKRIADRWPQYADHSRAYGRA